MTGLVLAEIKRLYNQTLFIDGHPVHKSKMVKRFVESTKGNLMLFILPEYSPDLNPDESVWSHVKPHYGRKKDNNWTRPD
jgi:transposase